ncbi:MAG TPA: hypothetical protein VKB57_08865 [Acidimicrobiales bacterium]|nr:hypothetical protein [Acidimicrobiales bacterium]
MGTSSAKPAKLLAYRDAGIAQVEKWEPEVANLSTALGGLRDALAGLDLPEGCELSILFEEVWFDTLTRNQRHLDEWVGDVGDEFLRASGRARDDIGPDDSFTVDDAAIVVGFADRDRAERQAADDAAALARILGPTGLINPYELANDPDKLDEMARLYPELRDILARSARFHADEDYAVALVNALGPTNVRTLADLANTFGIAADRGKADGAWDGYVVPLATLLGNADRSGRLDDSVRDALFDMDAGDEQGGEGADHNFIIKDQLADMRYRSLTLLLAAGTFSPETTARMADTIIHDGPLAPSFYDYSGFTNYQFLADHRPLAANEWAALDALTRDDHAANIFYGLHDGRNLYLLNGGLGADTAARRLGVSPGDVAGDIDRTLADSLTGGLQNYPLATGTVYSPETTRLIAHLVEAAGDDYVDAPDAVRRALAQISTPYTRDLAVAAEGYDRYLPDGRLPGLSGDEVDKFFREVSESKEARLVLGQNAAALVSTEIGESARDIAASDPNAFGQGSTLATAYYRELGEAWDHVQVDRLAQREALVAGWRSFTDPVVDLVSGKIVEKIPVVNAAADLPLAKNVVDGITGTIKDSINSAVYDHAIPRPELESMTTWRDAIEDDVEHAVAKGLYDDPATRQHFLDRAAAGGDPAYASVMADGQVTFDEFGRLGGVSDAVLTQSHRIVDGFQSDMAFDKMFGGG